MEKIQSHEIKDVYRIQDGLLIEINKYELLGLSYHPSLPKGTAKRVRGCKGLQVLMEDFTHPYDKKTFAKGTYFLGTRPVKPIKDPSLFKVEVKSSGGSIYGAISDIERVTQHIQFILDSYKIRS